MADIDAVLAQKPQPEPCPGQDAQYREHSMPRDEERPELEKVRIEVDDYR